MKHLFTLLTFFIAFIFFSFKTEENDPIVNRIIELGKNDNHADEWMSILCKRFGGRITGSVAYESAAQWAASRFREWGMEVILDEAGEVPVGFERGPFSGKMLSEEGMVLHFATPSYTSGTRGPQRGHVVLEPKTQQEFDRMKAKLRGAWVLITGKNDGYPIDYTEKGDHIRDSIIRLNEEIKAKNEKIKAENEKIKDKSKQKELIPLADTPALFYRQMCQAGILGIIQSAALPIRVMYDRKNLPEMRFETLPEIPDIKLDEHQYFIIEQKVKERQDVILEFDIRNYFRPGPVRYYNVIGVIKGTDYPDEYVIMGGHLDSYDISRGASDNATGAVQAMEAARLIMKAGGKPKRTILVCLWAAEEFGLLGSWHWINSNEEKLPKISNMFNWDSGPRVFTGISVSDSMMADMRKICSPISTINPDYQFEVSRREPQEKPEKAWGTDSGPFAVKGVPTMNFTASDVKGYDFNYYEIWHTERDDYSRLIPEYIAHNAIVTAVVVYGVANLDHLLNRQGYYLEKQKKQ
ncbi:MAG: M20/M25/M40 family metallo-hydrolase [Sphingobacteriales bacterium]|nr:M20/M25/M40 family metallo-hydrolase [Sphingobacteriales bacterium]